MKEKPLSDAQWERNVRTAKRKNAILFRHLLDLLKPLAASDPLVPDLCEMMALVLDGCGPQPPPGLGAEFAELAHQACLLQPGTSQRRTRRARALMTDLRQIADEEG